MRWALLLIFLAAAAAAPMSVTFNYVNDSFYYQGSSYTFIVTVRNDNTTVNDSYHVSLAGDAPYVLVNNNSSQYYTITNLTANASNATSVTVKVADITPFDSDYDFCVDVEDWNGTRNTSCLTMLIPAFATMNAELSYTPSDSATGTLKVNATTSTGNSTTRFNTTYWVYNSTMNCTAGANNSTSITVDFTNCSSGVYDIKVAATADTFTKSRTISSFFLFRNINLTASFFRIENFGYERPIEEIGTVKGLEQLRVRGTARYDSGTALSWPPDAFSTSYVNMTLAATINGTAVKENYTFRPNQYGNYSLDFLAPLNTSNYTVTLKAYGKYNFTSTITYYLTVNNTVSYVPPPTNASELLGKITMGVSGPHLFGDGAITLAITVDNNNSISVTGRPTLITDQFIVVEPASDSILGGRARDYVLSVEPKPFTRPGDYTIPLAFTTVYGNALQDVVLTVPEVEPAAGNASVFRYIEYSNNSRIILRVVNLLPVRTQALLREEIPKQVATTMKTVRDLVALCNETDYGCKLAYVLANGSCGDCPLAGTNLTSNCTANCTNRTFISFSPMYNRLIQDDPVVEWGFDLGSGEAAEASYTTLSLADPGWFAAPELVVNPEATPTPVPTATPTPSATATPEPTVEPTATPRPASLANMIFTALVILMLGLFALIGVAAYLLLRKRDAVEAFIARYSKQPEPTSQDEERERIRKIFIEEAEKKAKERPAEAPKPEAPKPAPEAPQPVKKGLLQQLNETFSPPKKKETPGAYVPEPAKPETETDKQVKSLKEIGKGFGEESK